MLILTKWNTEDCLTSVTTPPRSYPEKFEVSPMLKEYWPGGRCDKLHTDSELKNHSHYSYTTGRLKMLAHDYTVCCDSW